MSDRRRPRVLVVDDEPNNRQLLDVILRQAGYDVVLAADGHSAMAAAADRPPDLIFCDVMMPGLNGYEVTAVLTTDPRMAGVPVVLLSSLDDSSSRAHGIAAGAVDFLVKPVGRHDVLDCARRWLGARAKRPV